MGIRAFCPTRWTVRGDAIASYDFLLQVWEECLETKLDPDVKGRIIGVQTQMSQYKLLFGLHLCKKILLITDNLSKTLQKQTLSAAEGQEIARLTITTLKGMRSSGAFDLFFELVERFCDKHGVSKPSLPRKRKAPCHLEVGTGSALQYRNTIVKYITKSLIL